jgi:hypothetical protein
MAILDRPSQTGPTPGRRAAIGAAYAATLGTILVLVLRHQDIPFHGEDWIAALTGVLTRFGYFERRFSFAKGLRLNAFFASSYGPAYYAYDVFRTLLFERRLLPFNEVTFRYVTSLSAVVLVACSALALRPRFQSAQILSYLMLVGFSPQYVSYYRFYTVYPLMMLFQNVAVVAFLAHLERGRLSRLALFAAAIFLAVTTLATSVNVLAGCLLFLLVPARWRPWDPDLAAAPRSLLRFLVGAPARIAVLSVLVIALAAVVAFNWIHFDALMTSGALYQGSFAKSFQKTRTGAPDPMASLVAVFEETAVTLGPEFVVFALLAVANVVALRRLSHVSLISAFAFVIGLAECLWVVPTPQLRYAWRSIAYTFPMLVLVADNAGALLARTRRGGLLLALGVVFVWFDRRVHPLEDVENVLRPGTAVSPIKALGYVYRTDGFDDAARHCTALDVPLDGPTLFYLDHVDAGVLAGPGAPSRVCVAVLSQPPSQRLARAIEASGLVNRRSVTSQGAVVLDVYLNDAMAARWRQPAAIDSAEYSRRFTGSFRSFDQLFDARWAAVPTAGFRDGFY